MKKILLILVVGALVWYFLGRSRSVPTASEPSAPAGSADETLPIEPERSFSCDGRTHCSQMTSCEEATYFVRNCPGAKMDGDRDGIPCESQWCSGG